MTAPLVFSLLLTILGLIFTLSVLLLVVWRNRDFALIQFFSSLVLLQGGTLLTHISLLTDSPDDITEICLKFTLLGFALVTLAALALLLHLAATMKNAWVVVCRTGVAMLGVLQPAFWQQEVLDLDESLDHTLLGSPYTSLGQVIVAGIALYITLGLYAGWRYRWHINAPLVSGTVISLLIIQTISLSVPAVRELSITAAASGIVSGVLGYHLLRQYELAPRPFQTMWLRAMRDISQAATGPQAFFDILTGIAEQARLLLRTDVVCILLAIGPDRLQVVTVAGPAQSAAGRQIRIGEGLAGRVMQSLQSMRIDHYNTWNGRSTDFDDMPFYGSLSVPLIYNGELVGTINAYYITPRRAFAERDQMLLELLAPQAAITIATAHLEHELRTTQTHLQAVMAYSADAIMIFDSTGILKTANSAAQHHLQQIAGNTSIPLSTLDLATCTQDSQFTDELAQWTADPSDTREFEIGCKHLGQFAVQLRTIQNNFSNTPDLLMILHKLPERPG